MLSTVAEDDGYRRITSQSQNFQRKPCPVIRPASARDFDAIMEVENSSFPGDLAYSRRQMRYLIYRANSTTLVEECGGRITGYVTALFRNGSGVAGIETIGVLPERRGNGTGKRLLGAVEASMVERGARISRLEVSTGNERAVGMYARAGYSVRGCIPDYYINLHHGTRAAYRMEKNLGSR